MIRPKRSRPRTRSIELDVALDGELVRLFPEMPGARMASRRVRQALQEWLRIRGPAVDITRAMALAERTREHERDDDGA